MSFSKKIASLICLALFSTAIYAAGSVNALFHTPHNPVAGNPKGTISIVEFFDYQCGHCKQMAPVIEKIVQDNPNVRLVFKDLPFTGPMADYAARAALAANQQGKYYPLCKMMLASNAPLTEKSILQYAQNLGIDTKKLKRDMQSPSTTRMLRNAFQLANQLKVTGTPTFFIGKTNDKDLSKIKMISGEASQSELQAAINSAS